MKITNMRRHVNTKKCNNMNKSDDTIHKPSSVDSKHYASQWI